MPTFSIYGLKGKAIHEVEADYCESTQIGTLFWKRGGEHPIAFIPTSCNFLVCETRGKRNPLREALGRLLSKDILDPLIAVATIVFAAAAVWVGYNQWLLTKANVRAWITVGVKLNDDDTTTITYHNSGHTPAVLSSKVYGNFYDHQVKAQDASRELPLDVAILESSLDRPNPSDDLSTLVVDAENQALDPTRMPHVSPLYYVGSSLKAIPESEYNKHMHHDYFYVVGAILYKDARNEKHLTTFCYENRPPVGEDPGDGGALIACAFMNAI